MDNHRRRSGRRTFREETICMTRSRRRVSASDSPLPSGTVTFLFSDIEGSTQRWERNRAPMQKALRRHDALMRSAIAANGGHIFKTIGDAFCAAFSLAPDALIAALDAQRARCCDRKLQFLGASPGLSDHDLTRVQPYKTAGPARPSRAIAARNVSGGSVPNAKCSGAPLP